MTLTTDKPCIENNYSTRIRMYMIVYITIDYNNLNWNRSKKCKGVSIINFMIMG